MKSKSLFTLICQIILGPLPRNTSVIITRSIDRILTAFDDVVQVGLVKLRVNSVTEIKIIAETGTALL